MEQNFEFNDIEKEICLLLASTQILVWEQYCPKIWKVLNIFLLTPLISFPLPGIF